MSELDLEAIDVRATSAPEGPWFLSDCEGELMVWREAVLRGVTRDDTGAITGYQDPAGWCPGDLIAEWDLDTWDPGVDDDDDRIRAIAEFIAHARTDVPDLVAEVKRLRALDAEAALTNAETAIAQAFDKADERGASLDAMTVAELTAFVMDAIRGEPDA